MSECSNKVFFRVSSKQKLTDMPAKQTMASNQLNHQPRNYTQFLSDHQSLLSESHGSRFTSSQRTLSAPLAAHLSTSIPRPAQFSTGAARAPPAGLPPGARAARCGCARSAPAAAPAARSARLPAAPAAARRPAAAPAPTPAAGTGC